MAGPLRADVEMLNNAISGLGESFEARRREQTDAAFRQAMLDQAIERQKAAESHYQQMEAQQANTATKQQQAADLKDKQGFLNTIMQLNAAGQIDNLDPVNDWLANDEHFGKVGLQLKTPPTKPPPQVGQNAVAQALNQAENWRTKADEETDPIKKGRYTGFADMLEKSAEQSTKPKVNPADFDVVTEETPAQPGAPAVPATSGGLFRSATPAQPAIPAIPKTTTKRYVPRGTIPQSTATGTTADPNVLRQQAQQAISGGKDPAAVRARFKTLTGQDL